MVKLRTPPFFYSSGLVPENYVCSACKAHGVKLWRDYNTFLEHLELKCGKCTLKGVKKGDDYIKRSAVIGPDGKVDSKYGRTDQFGGLVPAVPTEDMETFWGYTSVPYAGVLWWRHLPTHPEGERDTLVPVKIGETQLDFTEIVALAEMMDCFYKQIRDEKDEAIHRHGYDQWLKLVRIFDDAEHAK